MLLSAGMKVSFLIISALLLCPLRTEDICPPPLLCHKTNLLNDHLSSSTLVSELRTSSLGPKQYYELYMAVFDALRDLSVFLKESHPVNHLADLYELVQYAGTTLVKSRTTLLSFLRSQWGKPLVINCLVFLLL